MPRRKEPRIPDAVLDQLLAGADPKTVFDPNGLFDDLKKALAERVLNAEMELSPIFGDNLIGQAATVVGWRLAGLATTSSPSANFTPRSVLATGYCRQGVASFAVRLRRA
jgi:hypothetical protein